MSDNAKRFETVRNKLNTLYPKTLSCNAAKHLNTLAGLISGIVGGKSVNLPQVACKTPDGTKATSREKRYSRWIDNERIDFDQYFLPFVEILLRNMTGDVLMLAIDGSVVGRGCVTLLVSVIFQGRAIPLSWIVVKGKKGHFPEKTHIELLNSVKEMIPEGKRVVLLGDGEFDGIDLQGAVEKFGWKHVCRTGKNIKLFLEGYEFQCGDVIPSLKSGKCIEMHNILFTKEKYGPVLVVFYWRKGCEEPIFLVTNVSSAKDACDLYAFRFRIETFFSDQKSRGFNIHKSHLSDPGKISRLMIAACLAYIWIIYLGIEAKKIG